MGVMLKPRIKRVISAYISADADEHAQAVADRERRSKSAAIDMILLEHHERERRAGVHQAPVVVRGETFPIVDPAKSAERIIKTPDPVDEIAGFPADEDDECTHEKATRTASGLRRCDCGKIRRVDGVWVTP